MHGISQQYVGKHSVYFDDHDLLGFSLVFCLPEEADTEKDPNPKDISVTVNI